MKTFFYDLETTGVDETKHAICQIAYCIEVDGKLRKEESLLINPFEGALIDNKALEVNGLKLEDLELGMTYRNLHEHLKFTMGQFVDCYNKMDKFFCVGFNSVAFDDRFLRALWTRNNDVYFGSWFHWPSLDAAILAAAKLYKDRPVMPNFKLDTVADFLGIKRVGAAHDALSDVRLTREIFNLVFKEASA